MLSMTDGHVTRTTIVKNLSVDKADFKLRYNLWMGRSRRKCVMVRIWCNDSLCVLIWAEADQTTGYWSGYVGDEIDLARRSKNSMFLSGMEIITVRRLKGFA